MYLFLSKSFNKSKIPYKTYLGVRHLASEGDVHVIRDVESVRFWDIRKIGRTRVNVYLVKLQPHIGYLVDSFEVTAHDLVGMSDTLATVTMSVNEPMES